MDDKLRVLILEDNEDDAILIAHELRRADFDVEWVRVDTKKAFEEELKNEPDLILADYSLPQYDALKALQLLKESNLDIPLIVISGAITEETAVRLIKEGANDYLLKDRMARLGPAVQQALDEHRLREDKQKAEQALSESEAKYRNLFEESREGIFTSDLSGQITECNPAFEELIGYSREEIIGQNLAHFFVDKSIQNRLFELRDTAGFLRNVEIDFIHKDGHVLHILFTGSLMMDQQGAPQSFLGIARDITERKRGQREMEVIVTVNAALRTAANRKTMVPIMADLIQGITQADSVAVILKNPYSEEMQVEAVTGKWRNYPDISIQLDRAVMDQLMDKGDGKSWPEPFSTPEINTNLPQESIDTLFCLPLSTTQENFGLVWINCNGQCTTENIHLAQVAANIAANAILRTTLHENSVRALQESEALATISRILNQNLDLETIFDQIVREAIDILPEAFRSVIHLYDEKLERLHAVAMSWIEDEDIKTKSLIEIRVSPTNEFDFGVLKPEDIDAATMSAGKGVAGRVIETGVPLFIGDTEADSRFLQTEHESSIKTIVVAPIMSGDLRLGTLSVLGNKPRAFSERDKNLVERLCLQASIAIENARLLEAERQQRELAEAQAEISALLNQSLEMDEVLAGILNHTMQFFNAGAVNIMLIVEDRLEVARQVGYGKTENEMDRFSLALDELPESYPLMYQVYQTGEKILVKDTRTNPYWVHYEKYEWVRSYVCIPLKVNEKVIGLLNLDSERPNAFGDLEMHQVNSFANSAAAAVENARLYEDLEQSLQTEQATRSQLIRADKLAGMGRMVASVAHELNNPLQTIKNCLFLIEQSFTAEEDMDLLELALSEVERLTSIVNRLRDVYRPVAHNEFFLTELVPMLTELEMLLETHLRRNRVELELDDLTPYEDICVNAFPDQLKQVFLNLSLNAIEAMQPDGGTLKIQVKKDEKNNEVGISFSDTGPGIHEDEMKIIFDPFYTTKATGMGLGLSICYDIMQNHNGSIQVENNPEIGVTFTVWLPLQDRHTTLPEAKAQAAD